MEYLPITISLITLLISLSVYNKASAIEARIKAMQISHDHISKEDGLPSHPVHDEVMQLIREGKKVSAIKKAREVHGMSLVEAKQYVDTLEAK